MYCVGARYFMLVLHNSKLVIHTYRKLILCILTTYWSIFILAYATEDLIYIIDFCILLCYLSVHVLHVLDYPPRTCN